MAKSAPLVTFEAFVKADEDFLPTWLSSDTWPCHVMTSLDLDEARKLVAYGRFLEECLTVWMVEHGQRVGLLRLTEINDPTPMLDIRIRSTHRGKGLGTLGLRWLTSHVFSTMPDKIRIEGQTRHDNIAMCKTFRKCGYVKEANYRRCWPAPDGRYFDSVAYGILREDWASGTLTPVSWNDDEFGPNNPGAATQEGFGKPHAHDWIESGVPDAELIARAAAAVNPRRLSGTVEAGGVGCALLTDAGNVYLGTCIDAACGLGFCAERNAIGTMVTGGESRIVSIVAVDWDRKRILPPCGACRELIAQLDPFNGSTRVLMPEGRVVKLEGILPEHWDRPSQ